MHSILSSWSYALDACAAAILLPLAIAILVSGLDDVTLNAVWLWNSAKRRFQSGAIHSTCDRTLGPEKLIAIFVPLWREHSVIGGMVEHNVAAIHYDNYHFFIGGYPNDEPTLEAVRELETRFPHVHLAVCPHDGPTSKAD